MGDFKDNKKIDKNNGELNITDVYKYDVMNENIY
jgi:hypothetical protein